MKEAIAMEHFGLELGASKYGHKLTRENFAVINPRSTLYSGTPAVMKKLYDEKNPIFLRKHGIERWTDETCRTYTEEFANGT